MLNLKKIALICLLCLLNFSAFADKKPYKEIGAYRVFYSAFNSSFILPNIAEIYGIARGKDKGLVTIGVTLDGKIGGVEAIIAGDITNMLAQRKNLKFIEIKDRDAVYYIAPFEYYNEDFLTFKITVRTKEEDESFPISFQKKFYYEK